MELSSFLFNGSLVLTPWLIVLVAWTLVWKGIGLWKAGRNNHLVMFVIMLILNTAGILPIFYLLWLRFGKEDKIEQVGVKKVSVKKKKKK